jgi:hypothetical protein
MSPEVITTSCSSVTGLVVEDPLASFFPDVPGHIIENLQLIWGCNIGILSH